MNHKFQNHQYSDSGILQIQGERRRLKAVLMVSVPHQFLRMKWEGHHLKLYWILRTPPRLLWYHDCHKCFDLMEERENKQALMKVPIKIGQNKIIPTSHCSTQTQFYPSLVLFWMVVFDKEKSTFLVWHKSLRRRKYIAEMRSLSTIIPVKNTSWIP